jgi:excisionase family DNA binding protein
VDPLQLITVDELAGLLRVKKSWIYDQVQRGALPVVRVGKHLRFRRVDVEAYLSASMGGPATDRDG